VQVSYWRITVRLYLYLTYTLQSVYTKKKYICTGMSLVSKYGMCYPYHRDIIYVLQESNYRQYRYIYVHVSLYFVRVSIKVITAVRFQHRAAGGEQTDTLIRRRRWRLVMPIGGMRLAPDVDISPS
jgi:hypothetical protein